MAYLDTWDQVSSLDAGEYYWSTIIGGDGTWYACAFDQPLYRSTDDGDTWSQITAVAGWHDCCTSSNGAIVYALGVVGGSGSVYKSTNYGASFSEIVSTAGKNWISICCSADGTKVYACFGPITGDVWVSGDSGANWTPVGLSEDLVQISCSADGTKVVVGNNAASDYVRVSTDSGVTFPTVGALGRWLAVCMSRDGSTIYAGKYGEYIYKSINDGATWTASLSTNDSWGGIGCIADGSKALALGSNNIYTSEDSGANWTDVYSYSGGGFDCNVTDALSLDGSLAFVGTYGGVQYPLRSPALFSITSITPNIGTTSGGTPVIIEGNGFDPLATAAVDGEDLSEIDVVSSTEIRGVTPPGTIGAKDVTVTNP